MHTPNILSPRNENVDLVPLLAPTLKELWHRFPALPSWTRDEIGSVKPFYPRYAQLERVLVLGLNPSYSAKDRDLLTYETDFDSHTYFRRMARLMRCAASKYQELFQHLPETADEQLYYFDKLEWAHLDLLYMRTTSQQALQKQLWTEPGAADFVWEQLQLTKQLLTHLQPTMLLVANRLGQILTGFDKDPKTGDNEWMGLQFTSEPDELGAYRITGSTTAGRSDPNGAFSLVGTPVFFTGSFAGTNPRSAANDELLASHLAAASLREGTRYFAQWRMR
jgi:hypothetical protein